MEERYGSFVGDPQYLPPNLLAETPLSFSGRTVLSKQSQSLGGGTKTPPQHCKHYGVSIIWVDPGQVRAASMEEAVGKLTTCTSSGTDWPYALVWLHEATCHAPLLKDGHLGILPQRGAEAPLMGGSANLRSANSLLPAPKLSTP